MWPKVWNFEVRRPCWLAWVVVILTNFTNFLLLQNFKLQKSAIVFMRRQKKSFSQKVNYKESWKKEKKMTATFLFLYSFNDTSRLTTHSLLNVIRYSGSKSFFVSDKCDIFLITFSQTHGHRTKVLFYWLVENNLEGGNFDIKGAWLYAWKKNFLN